MHIWKHSTCVLLIFEKLASQGDGLVRIAEWAPIERSPHVSPGSLDIMSPIDYFISTDDARFPIIICRFY